MKFKIGDTVRCIKLVQPHLSLAKVGNVYKIVRVDRGDKYYSYKTEEGLWFNESELELIRTFEKSDLLSGYLVERNDGTLRLVMATRSGMYLTDGDVYLTLDDYNDNLENTINKALSIKRVYGFTSIPSQTLELRTEGRLLIWERPEEAKEITISDIEEKFGCKVKIVKEEN